MKKKPKKKKSRKLIFDSEGLQMLASQLKKVREERGFTQESLAFESGLSLSQIGRIETCRINPTVSTMFAIARALEVPVNRLFDFKLT